MPRKYLRKFGTQPRVQWTEEQLVQANISPENEKRLVSHIQKLSSAGFAPYWTTIRRLAYQFAEKLGIRCKFSN
ncbi:hypothetical protein PR048_012719 [Dryococelus australis]|uniref:Uncharacterized protein n=1 Tax=Dryococelus australis TaxID=614101 RepID=A0ABQ9HRL4_9NEOP|nr:hypothetical protein PR048_012719 [Dryococelus australis]